MSPKCIRFALSMLRGLEDANLESEIKVGSAMLHSTSDKAANIRFESWSNLQD